MFRIIDILRHMNRKYCSVLELNNVNSPEVIDHGRSWCPFNPTLVDEQKRFDQMKRKMAQNRC